MYNMLLGTIFIRLLRKTNINKFKININLMYYFTDWKRPGEAGVVIKLGIGNKINLRLYVYVLRVNPTKI